jgi:hypothetical protein
MFFSSSTQSSSAIVSHNCPDTAGVGAVNNDVDARDEAEVGIGDVSDDVDEAVGIDCRGAAGDDDDVCGSVVEADDTGIAGDEDEETWGYNEYGVGKSMARSCRQSASVGGGVTSQYATVPSESMSS